MRRPKSQPHISIPMQIPENLLALSMLIRKRQMELEAEKNES